MGTCPQHSGCRLRLAQSIAATSETNLRFLAFCDPLHRTKSIPSSYCCETNTLWKITGDLSNAWTLFPATTLRAAPHCRSSSSCWGTVTWCPANLDRRLSLSRSPVLLMAHRTLEMPADPTSMSFLLDSHCSTSHVQHTMHSPDPARWAPSDHRWGRWCSPTPLPSPRTALDSF